MKDPILNNKRRPAVGQGMESETYLIPVLLLLCGILSSCNMSANKPRYISSIIAEYYPSGSTISYLDNRFYVMGDDAAEILILDSTSRELQRIGIFPKGDRARLPKTLKADIEASAVIRRSTGALILFMGSGSLSPHRDSAFFFDPVTKAIERTSMETFYRQLRTEFHDLNIEGACSMGTMLLIGIRANSTYPDNYLVLTNTEKGSFQYTRKVKLQLPVINSGISGMEYDAARDMLFLTLSTEETSNAFDDGRIGNSYLAVVSRVSSMLDQDVIVIDTVSNLNDLHPEFSGQKIESVSLTSNAHELLLVADDDQGNTKFFTIGF